MGKNISKEDIHAHYSTKETLGKGNFATVKKAIRKIDGQEFAVKIIKKTNLDQEELAVVHDEVEIMHKIEHENAVRLIEIFETDKKLYLVMELLTGGELFDRIVARGQFTEKEAAKVIRDVSSALKYLHEIGVVHRDLKPENLIYQSKDVKSPIKITDFGLAKFMRIPQGVMKTQCGTPGYVAPEVLYGKQYTSAVDMWSLGVILYILLCGFPPFYAENGNTKELYRQIKKGEYDFPDPYWTDITEEAKDLVKRLLCVNDKHRLTAAQVLQHPWVCGNSASSRSLGQKHIMLMGQHVARNKVWRAVEAVMAVNKLANLMEKHMSEKKEAIH